MDFSREQSKYLIGCYGLAETNIVMAGELFENKFGQRPTREEAIHRLSVEGIVNSPRYLKTGSDNMITKLRFYTSFVRFDGDFESVRQDLGLDLARFVYVCRQFKEFQENPLVKMQKKSPRALDPPSDNYRIQGIRRGNSKKLPSF